MDLKKKEEKGQIELFLARWGRGKRHVPSVKKPVKVLKVINPSVKKDKKALKRVELQGLWNWGAPRPQPNTSSYVFEERLQKRGFKILGSGCFSSVYAKDGSDRVIKVTRKIDNWIDYIHWASEKGYCGTYAPKVYSYKKSKCGSYSLAIVERMEKGLRKIGKDDDLQVVSSLICLAMRNHTMANLMIDEVTPGLSKFLVDFNNRFGHDRFDISGDNMMVRKDGTFCITDPVCGKSELKVNRLRSKDFMSLAPANLKDYYVRILYT